MRTGCSERIHEKLHHDLTEALRFEAYCHMCALVEHSNGQARSMDNVHRVGSMYY